MGIYDRLKFAFTGRLPNRNQYEEKSVGQMVLPWQQGQPQYMPHSYESYALNAYSKNELVFACINEKATSLPEATLRAYRRTKDGEEEIPDHPLRQLMQKPNPFMTEFELMEMTVTYLDIAGNAFWEKGRSAAGRVVEIWPLRPDRVRIVPDNVKYISQYVYEIGGIWYPLDPDDVIHFKYFHPTDYFFGMSPLKAISRAVGTDNEATDFVQSMLQNNATPATVVTTQTAIDEALSTRLSRIWKKKFGGKNRGEPAILQAGMDVKSIGMNLRDLEFPDLRTVSETRICSGFGVPPILVGANAGLQRSTFSNYKEARESFWEETLSPLMVRLGGRVNLGMMPEYGSDSNVYCRFDTTNVRALQENENDKWSRATAAKKDGIITKNEARSVLGYKPVPDGDKFTEDEKPDPDQEEQNKNKNLQKQKEADLEGKGFFISTKEALPEHLQLQKIADNAMPEMMRAFIAAVAATQGSLTLDAVEKALESGNIEAAMVAINWDILDESLSVFKPIITGIVGLAGPVAATALSANFGISLNFKLLNPLAVDWIKSHTGELITNVGLNTKLAVRSIIQDAFKNGGHPRETARTIKQFIGLTERGARAALKYRAKLALDKTLPQEQLNKMAAAYTRRLVEHRAETIARTETIMASNNGQLLLWQQAAEKGLLDKNKMYKRWLTTKDDMACPICKKMHGETVHLDAKFSGGVLCPTRHPRCRCGMGLVEIKAGGKN